MAKFWKLIKKNGSIDHVNQTLLNVHHDMSRINMHSDSKCVSSAKTDQLRVYQCKGCTCCHCIRSTAYVKSLLWA